MRHYLSILGATAVMACGLITAVMAQAPVAVPAVSPPEKIVEGYATPDYRELIQTVVVLGTYDINTTAVAHEYAKLMDCPSYRKFYNDDFAWNNVRKKIVQRVLERQESYRVFYEYSGVIKLSSYNFGSQSFPLTSKTQFDNVGRMDIIDANTSNSYLCKTGVKDVDDRNEPFFPQTIGLELSKPLTMKNVAMSPERGQALLAKLDARGVQDRAIFVRFRFRVVDQPKLLRDRNNQVWRADMVGHLENIDLFLDRDLTMWVASVPVE